MRDAERPITGWGGGLHRQVVHNEVRWHSVPESLRDYGVAEGHVKVFHGDELVWSGDVDGMVAFQAMTLPGTDDGIVVMDWSHLPPDVEEWHPFPNLLRIRPDGSRVWTASCPTARFPTRVPSGTTSAGRIPVVPCGRAEPRDRLRSPLLVHEVALPSLARPSHPSGWS